MSATSSRTFRETQRTDEISATTRGRPTVPRESALHALVATDSRAPGTIARLALGLVMFPHGAQKMLGWFGGPGLSGTFDALTSKGGLPGVVAGAVIFTEFVSALLLITGTFTRIAAFGIMTIMIGAILTTHLPNGFFMNWTGTQAGEGFEYHLLAIGMALVAIVLGGGALSVDRWMTTRGTAERGRPRGVVVEPVTRD
jgi:putative oxidoreductase